MELPHRNKGDELLAPGEMTDIRRRLQGVAGRHDLTSVIACAFDHRTRMLPFIYADTHMAPAGVRAVGAAMVEAGFNKTRIVLQQWNRNFRPSRMRLDGGIPDIFMVSTPMHPAGAGMRFQFAFRPCAGRNEMLHLRINPRNYATNRAATATRGDSKEPVAPRGSTDGLSPPISEDIPPRTSASPDGNWAAASPGSSSGSHRPAHRPGGC